MSARKLTEGAICLAIYTIMLLLFLYLPIFGVLFSFALPLPFLYYTAKYNWKDGLLFFVASFILTFIAGNWIALPVPFLYGIVGLVLGWNIYNQRDAFISFSTATLAFLFSAVIFYVLSAVFFDMNYLREVQNTFNETFNETISMMKLMGQDTSQLKEQLEAAIDLMTTLLPTILLLSSALIVLVIQFISYPILKRLGIQVKAPKPLRDITLPKSLIWYFLLISVLSLAIDADKGTFLYNVFTNLLYLIDFLFVIQAITFIFSFCYQKRLHKAWAIIATVLILLNPLFNHLARLLGIIDLGFDLRKRIQKK